MTPEKKKTLNVDPIEAFQEWLRMHRSIFGIEYSEQGDAMIEKSRATSELRGSLDILKKMGIRRRRRR